MNYSDTEMACHAGAIKQEDKQCFKVLRETMTEQALSIEYVMRGYSRMTVRQLATACLLSEPEVEFILEQMTQNKITESVGIWHTLTQEYKNMQG